MQLLIIFAAKYLFVIVALLAAYVWWRLPKGQRLQVALQAMLGLGFAAILVKVAGALHPDVRSFVEHHFTPLVAQKGDNGFPSDHTTFTMLAAFTVLPFARKWGWWLAGLALIVGLSRVAAGVHSLQDIVGGIVVAAVSVAIAYYLADWIAQTWQQKKSKKSVAAVGRWFHPQSLLDRTFEIGIILKGLDGVVELIGAALVAFVPAQSILHLASRLASSDPAQAHDFIAAHILQYGYELTGRDKWFATLFLLSHGLIKIVLVVGLLRSLPWAYPFAFVALGSFTLYQLWLIAHHPTVGMILLTLFDLFIIWLTWREYQKFKQQRSIG